MPDLATLTLPVLPLSSGVVLPQMVITIALETAEARAAAEAATGTDGRLLLVPRVDGRYASVGVLASIESTGQLPGGTPALVVRARQRARLGTGVVGTTEALWLQAEVVTEDDPTPGDHELAAELRGTVRALFDRLGGRRLTEVLRGIDDPGALADAAGWWPDLGIDRKVELLETTGLTERLGKVLGWARDALAELEVADKIRTDVAEGMEQGQREFLLRQQLAAIRKELGDSGDDDQVEGYRARLEALGDRLPAAARTAVERELDRLERTNPQATEHAWALTWLDTVFELPWGERSPDRLDLDDARATLDADHHGLGDVKDRIVEFLAVRRLRAERTGRADPADPAGTRVPPASERGHGTAVLLVGPPGVGKTSLGESVARALGRSFVRAALGGVRDEAEIRGHRRTYVGAQPGRLVRAMTEAATMNPVILLDEVDKVGADWRGDPSAALLEVLDPAQNHTFRDHYLEIELDLSDVLFVATANVLDTVPGPLLDRLEVVRLDGYTEDEKVGIARDHLLARQVDQHGLRSDEVALTDAALRALVRGYTREAGVRGLEREIAKVLRKAAVAVAVGTGSGGRGGGPTVVIDADDVIDYVGRPRFDDEVAARVDGPGVATGLAVTGAGGDVLFVEATAMAASDATEARLTVTGQLGDVMRESAEIALSYVRSRRDQLGLAAGVESQRIHVHFPAGAVPKDGPSAGITMTTALVSLLTGRPVRDTVAMTGEVTLQGRVLPIGGVKQKVLAAHRAGLAEVILPARNGPDLDDVPAAVRDGLTIHLVDDVAQVLDIALEPAA